MNMRVGRYLIYGLIDPRDRGLRYIGKTHKRREWRLKEHIELANENDSRPVYIWIRELLSIGMEPEIFVLERISADSDWRLSERNMISFWKNEQQITFPYTHPPKTKKSSETLINYASLLNATNGG